METAGAGINFKDGLPHLFDLRFADDILLLGRSALEDFFILHFLMETLAETGLIFNFGQNDKRNSTSIPPPRTE